mmetsp:Transcript_47374/g.52975  ORF Transcript_47374/g.52975 Transcript_47374/m.52975 type:complete len:126 (+) Transcript_47374:51-428(+)
MVVLRSFLCCCRLPRQPFLSTTRQYLISSVRESGLFSSFPPESQFSSSSSSAIINSNININIRHQPQQRTNVGESGIGLGVGVGIQERERESIFSYGTIELPLPMSVGRYNGKEIDEGARYCTHS